MEFFHILNRGVEKRDIVLTDDDRMRFVRSLYLFNDKRPVHSASIHTKNQSHENRNQNLLVHIHAWCLMNNHYHLLLSAVDDDINNISLFLKKLNGGYAKFFNEKYDRSGYLWQGKTKKILIENNAHFLYIPYYIHLNPLDYTHKAWRSGSVKNYTTARDCLKKYRWSSLQDYLGEKNFPSVIYKNILAETLGTPKQQNKEIQKLLQDTNFLTKSKQIE